MKNPTISRVLAKKIIDETILNRIIGEWKICNLRCEGNINNLYSEHFLPEKSMEEFLHYLIDEFEPNPIEPNKIYEKYREFEFHGGEICLDSNPLKLGFAIPQKWLIRTTLELHGEYFEYKEDNVESFITDMIKGLPNIILSNKTVKKPDRKAWLTWDIDNSALNDPFSFVKLNKKLEVQINLGLDHDDFIKDQMLLFIFDSSKIGHDLALIRPTICDAGDYPAFSPPHIDFDCHGLTKPLRTKYDIGGVELIATPKPEAICLGSILFWNHLTTLRRFH
jgi:hypothetical protein